MVWIYNTGIFLFTCLIRFASLFDEKAKLFLEGRKNIFAGLEARVPANRKKIWFHFASLGEFEQGRPVLEAIKNKYPEKYIIITFFSPSGYEIRKNYAGADAVFYLPVDTRKNAGRFIEIVQPQIAFFIKYEFWHHYYSTLKKHDIPLYVISAIFRKEQIFFKWYGGFYRSILQCVTYFFVQNDESKHLLNAIGMKNVLISGDTRFDRVAENAQHPSDLPVVKAFCKDMPTIICGSTWPADEQLIAALAEENTQWKFIIAPHEIDAVRIASLSKNFPDSIRYSKITDEKTNNAVQTLIIDNIGMLSALYQYGQIAYIGGGFGKGIHNTLEAAAFGLPVIFGPNYRKFQEAKELIAHGAAKSIDNFEGLRMAFKQLTDDSRLSTGIRKYIDTKRGATKRITDQVFEK